MVTGYSDVLIGLQYGDEGKARVIDSIAHNYDIVARFNGGPNAGHTVKKGDASIALHQIPSAVFLPETKLYVGSGCVLNLEKLVSEIDEINALGIDINDRLHISSQATLIQPGHLLCDKKTGERIGTTNNGIGPAYSDKALRMDDKRLLTIRLGDLTGDYNRSIDAIKNNLVYTMAQYGLETNIDETMHNLEDAFKKIAPFIEEDALFMDRNVRNGKRVLFEGAQSFMLDITKGSVPYVTSSSTLAGAAYVGGDLSPKYHRKTIGVGKAIMSRVGNGPFVSEFGRRTSEEYCMEDKGRAHTKEKEKEYDINSLLKSEDPFEIGIALRILGNEYGASTGRPRRVGMLDLVQLSYAARINGVDTLFINKFDLLRDYNDTIIKGIPLVTGYTLDEKEIDYVPTSNEQHRRVFPHIKIMNGFNDSIENARAPEDLPGEIHHLLERISEQTNCDIMGIGVGPEREQHVRLNNP